MRKGQEQALRVQNLFLHEGTAIGESPLFACSSFDGPDTNNPTIPVENYTNTPLTILQLKALHDQGF
jgi:hypothetical protein